jgi:hypothetical protein
MHAITGGASATVMGTFFLTNGQKSNLLYKTKITKKVQKIAAIIKLPA